MTGFLLSRITRLPEVFNGDIGVITAIDQESQEVAVDFDGRPVSYDFSELDELEPAYAISVHKAQGSEYPAVVLPVMTQHYLKGSFAYEIHGRIPTVS
jgi:exodeoxyribonuclease V alpha subunit